MYTARQLICTFPDHSKYTPFTTSGIICDGSEKTSFSVSTLSSSSPKKNKKTPFFLHFNMYSLRRRVWDLRKREATYQIVSCCFFFFFFFTAELLHRSNFCPYGSPEKAPPDTQLRLGTLNKYKDPFRRFHHHHHLLLPLALPLSNIYQRRASFALAAPVGSSSAIGRGGSIA